MPIDYSIAQETPALGVGDQGDVRGILAGAANPWDAYTSVPIGSRYFKSDGTWYWKSGAGDTSGDWTKIDLLDVDLPSVQARRTASLDVTTTLTLQAWTTVDLNASTDIENTPAILSHDTVTNPSRVTIGEDGLYYVGYNLPGMEFFTTSVQSNETSGAGRVIKNGTTELAGSFAEDGGYWSNTFQTDQPCGIENGFLVELEVGDYIELQAQGFPRRVADVNFTATLPDGAVLRVVRQTGRKGDQGLPGSGSTITLKKDGLGVPNTPHSILNFTGAGVSVTDAGGGQADVDIPGTKHDRQQANASREDQIDDSAYQDVDSMTLTTKNLGAVGSYLCNFSCAYGPDGDKQEDETITFRFNFGGTAETASEITVQQTTADKDGGQKDQYTPFSFQFLKTGIASGTVVKVEAITSDKTCNVLRRVLTIDGILDSQVIP